MTTARERNLIDKGYSLRTFSRHARYNDAEAKVEAEAFRAKGYYAQIVSCESGNYLFAKKK
jgi:hypothetical protein